MLLFVAAVLAGMVMGPVLVDGLATLLSPAAAIAVAPQQEVPAGPNAPKLWECRVAEVGVFDNRVFVHCWNPDGAIANWAYPTSQVERANRVLSVLLTAQATGRRVGILYDTTDDGSAFGCAVATCRPIQAVSLN
jgi:hypothetical protein